MLSAGWPRFCGWAILQLGEAKNGCREGVTSCGGVGVEAEAAEAVVEVWFAGNIVGSAFEHP